MAKHSDSHHYHFPWRGGNRFRLHVDGGNFFPAMLKAIQRARHVVALEMYLVESGKLFNQFIDALLAAARRDVKVFILVDDFGAGGINRHDRHRLQHANIALCYYNPMHYGRLGRILFRDHRKLLLVDGQIAFVGGAGLTDAFDERYAGQHPWHDVMVEVRGPCVADWAGLFVETWPLQNAEQGVLNHISQREHAPHQPQLGRVSLTHTSSGRQEIKRSLLKRLKSAEHWVWISTAYFVPSWKIRRTLRKAARRGVDVRLLLPGPHNDHPGIRHAGRRFYYNLLKHGVRIFEYQPRFNHTKAHLCDQWCSIGSSNLDRWNLLWNLEANQEIDDQDFAEELKHMFEHDFDDSSEITYEHWRRRPWYHRLQESFWGRVDIWLNRFTARWRNYRD
ncbi:hypothetical protein Tel_14100 [Candidatus Tenderia electrophaga]|jgi:phosphatidylserine/phosphatidylglycerophosphate/cardiolipin synthase-like enzyme|uniref:PLD phosphodiesterase domain-containing protein n=1 Tax=Candidatus Tenderia electrophaga TaxID=1748243 RepID=A0A0S2TGD6_9GAMM|nr:hypothetical protein Tel_14100 [Candidatus Tenderia electrophaga]